MQEIDFHRAMHRPGTLVDVGAHTGRMTRALAALPDSRVLAFEPVPPTFARLREGFGDAVPANVTLRPEAVGESAGQAVISAPCRMNGHRW